MSPAPYFNPRSHTGSDQRRCDYWVCSKHFNPRSHTGSDTIYQDHKAVLASFQSTLPHGERLTIKDNQIHTIWISIHAPTRGATQKNYSLLLIKIISIHAPTRGATSQSLDFNNTICISIHAPTRGATKGLYCGLYIEIFQSTLPHGERLPARQ